MNLDSGNRVPALRFKDEMGKEYPDWEELTLACIGKIIGGGTPDTSRKDFWNGSIVWYTPVEIEEKYSTISLRTISEDGLKNSSAKLLPKGSVLFTSRATIGKVTIVSCECTTNQGFQSFVVDNSNFSNEFLYYWLTNNVHEFFRRANGSTYLEITGKEIKSIPYIVPLLQEQQKIANFLSSVDTRIEQLEKKKSLLEQYKKGLMQKLFSQEIRFKDDEGKEYPEWEEKVLEAMSTIVMGTSPSSSAYNKDQIGLPLIQGNADIENRKSAPRIYTSIITKECNPDDILVSVRAPVGEISVSTHTACIGRGVAAVRVKKKISQGFLYQMLIWFEPKWRFFSQGSTFDSINSKDLKSLRLTKPYFEEQQKIAKFLSSIDKTIELVTEQINRTREFKKGLLQQMFV